MAAPRPPRRSDRWITPPVVCVALLCGAIVILGVVGAVAYLAARGLDAEPVLKLAGMAVAAVSSLGSFVLQLANRRTVAAAERNSGQLIGTQRALVAAHQDLADVVWDVHDALPRPVARHVAGEAATAVYDAAPSPPGRK